MEKNISELTTVIENLFWLKAQMPNAISNWQSNNPDCRYFTGIMNDVCNNPRSIVPQYLDPLIDWLLKYGENLKGRIAFGGANGVDNFIKAGLRNIYNFVLIADFFSQNSRFFYPSAPVHRFQEYVDSKKKQEEYSQLIDLLLSKLIGCNEKLSFLFLKLSQTVKKLPDDLKKIQNYLSNYCSTLKIRELKR